MKSTIEYLWTGIDLTHNINGLNITRKKFHTKVRTLSNLIESPTIQDFPIWSFDGSSTGHINIEHPTSPTSPTNPTSLSNPTNSNTEIILKPVKFYPHPFGLDWLVLCETLNIDGSAHCTNSRSLSIETFRLTESLEPWYGLEQEYVFMDSHTDGIYGWNMSNPKYYPVQTEHYCNTGIEFCKLRPIVQEHYLKCLKMGINISGTNAEVMPSQWEFQIGPTVGINAGDELTVARFVLERISESHNLYINYHSKPLANYNGSGCHHNFSTISTRKLDKTTFEDFYKNKFIQFSNNHIYTLRSYGDDNNQRLTGIHETSNMNLFSYGIGTRHTSIRIPVNTYTYFEDRRPSSSCDPYLSTCALLKTYITENKLI
jgi:glutamine synthetase